MIGLKQKTTQDDWVPLVNASYANPDYERANHLVKEAASRVKSIIKVGDRVGWGWSGGKDSQGLRVVMNEVGVEDCYLGISALEYPDFLAWATNNMPERLDIILNDKVNIDWLVRNPKMLFPDYSHASRWFQMIQGKARKTYAVKHKKDLLFLGRRKSDMNKKPDYMEGDTRVVSPIYDWTHEDLIAVIGAYDLPLPPCYAWPRGFQVGTGSWAARQWTGSIENGWSEVYSIDPQIVENAANKIESAMIFLDTQQPHGS
jgi:3'-phosphoadenosine 5'-phosphosulfate sulfotransferase (PAPS reductase)/FAD synthetase